MTRNLTGNMIVAEDAAPTAETAEVAEPGQMTYAQIVEKISVQTEVPEAKVRAVIDALEVTVIEGLIKNSRIRIGHWGSFRKPMLGAGKRRNPQTGDMIDVAERPAVRFDAGTRWMDSIKAGVLTINTRQPKAKPEGEAAAKPAKEAAPKAAPKAAAPAKAATPAPAAMTQDVADALAELEA